jgi:tetratricopeptide (TPR) repeat protein
MEFSLGNTERRVFNPAMRVLAYFALVFGCLLVLQQLPFLGWLFRVPLLGFFLTAILLSGVIARGTVWLGSMANLRKGLRELGVVDTPQMRGKLGRLLLQSGRAKQAIEPLSEAMEAQGENLEWRYRLGMAYLQTGAADRALELFDGALEVDERYAYGDLLMQKAMAHRAQGQYQAALEALMRNERVQGASPEQVFRLGCAHKSMGNKGEARATFARLSQLVQQAPKYQKSAARKYALRGWIAGLGC